MANLRTEIRDKIIELLSGETDAGVRVYSTRTRTIWENAMPAISVYTENETAEIESEAPRRYLRTVTLVIEIYAKATDSVDDDLDAIAAQVETVMDQADTLGELVSDVVYTGAEMALMGEGGKLTGATVMKYEVEYFTEAGVILDNTADRLDTVQTDWEASPADGIAKAADTLDFEDTHD